MKMIQTNIERPGSKFILKIHFNFSRRIQNRESATRVRNRKKNHVEILEDEINHLKQINTDLKARNNSLASENQYLKQKLSYFEKNSAPVYPDTMLGGPTMIPDQLPDQTDSILDFMDKGEMESSQIPIEPKYIRTAPNQKFRRHMTLLGVFTVLLCIYGLLPKTEAGTVQLFASPKNLFSSSRDNTNIDSPNTQNTTINSPTPLLENEPSEERDNNGEKERVGPRDSDREGPRERDGTRDREGPRGRDFGEPKNSKFENEPKPVGDGWRDGPGKPRSGHPPPRGRGFPKFPPKKDGYNNSSFSIYTFGEIMVIVSYTLYLIFVGFSAYKIHSQKKKNLATTRSI